MVTTPGVPEASKQAATTEPVIERATFKVTGMTCAGCEATIKIALEKTPGVRRAEVSYDRGEAVVEYNHNLTNKAKLCDAINETGYKCELPK